MSTFAALGLRSELINALSELGFEEPTPVQEQVIPLILQKKVDIVSLAQTGTGKTAAFGLPLIQLTDPNSRQTQGLVLCPTRELCMQVSEDLKAFSRFIEGISILAVYGGASIEQQIRELRKGVQIIVATPGRLRDLINRGRVDISGVRYAVFDEADEMLQMGFQDELNAILAQTPKEKNTLLFSATMSKEVADIASRYMTQPVEVTVGARNAGAENVTHEYYMINARDRYLALKRILDNAPDIYSIIFCRTRIDTQEIADKLIQDGYKADSLHGDLTQSQRDLVMKKFHSRHLQLLVATDVAARGLDVSDLTHVINYSLPDDTAGYTHRSGRTGRAGRTGISVALVDARDLYKIRQIETRLKKSFKQRLVPGGQEICRKQLAGVVDRLGQAVVDYEQIDPLYAEIAGQLEGLDREQLIKKFLALEMNRLLEYYRHAPDLNPAKKSMGPSRFKEERKPSQRREASNPYQRHGTSQRNETASYQRHEAAAPQQRHEVSSLPLRQHEGSGDREFARFHLNAGRRNGILPEYLISTINEVSGGGRIKVGKIEIMRNTSMLEGESRFIPQILHAFQHVKVNGRPVTVKVLQNRPPIRGDRPSGSGSSSRRFKRDNEQHS